MKQTLTARHAINLIACLHGDGPLPGLPVQADPDAPEDGALAAFIRSPEGQRAFSIDVYPTEEYTAADIAHEIGHFPDAEGIGSGAYASPDHPILLKGHLSISI